MRAMASANLLQGAAMLLVCKVPIQMIACLMKRDDRAQWLEWRAPKAKACRGRVSWQNFCSAAPDGRNPRSPFVPGSPSNSLQDLCSHLTRLELPHPAPLAKQRHETGCVLAHSKMACSEQLPCRAAKPRDHIAAAAAHR